MLNLSHQTLDQILAFGLILFGVEVHGGQHCFQAVVNGTGEREAAGKENAKGDECNRDQHKEQAQGVDKGRRLDCLDQFPGLLDGGNGSGQLQDLGYGENGQFCGGWPAIGGFCLPQLP
jgi:hypothetical protein